MQEHLQQLEDEYNAKIPDPKQHRRYVTPEAIDAYLQQHPDF